ncbi:MAG: endo-1,4-beta-xylanase [Phycisphaerales bacterium]
MLSFAVFDDAGPARGFVVRHAHVFGPDEVAIPAEITFEDGVIRCRKGSTEAAGLSLQYRADLPAEGPAAGRAIGLFTLRTCLLPERDEPYLLTLELARHRIMLVLNKLEQWGLFDLPADHAAIARFERARHRFAEALVAQRSSNGASAHGLSLGADRASRDALGLAVDAGEQLTMIQADRQLRQRFTGELFKQAARQHADSIAADRVLPEGAVKSRDGAGVVLQGPPTIGCVINPGQFVEPVTKQAAALCDFISVPMRWIEMEPVEGRYSFARTDKWIEWAVRTAKLPVWGGPIIDMRHACIPEWLYIWENDYETLRELVYEHVKQVVTRYRRTVQRWTVVSGLHVAEGLSLSLERVMDLTRVAVLLVRKLQPSARVQVEITQPWGEYFAGSRRSIPPTVYAEMIGQAGIAVDALALRLHGGQTPPGRSTRDLMALSAILDRYADFDKPIVVSGLGVPSRGSEANGTVEDPGSWRGGWTPERQAEWLSRAVAIAASKPFVHGVCWQDLTDAALPGEAPWCGLLTEAGVPKPAAGRFAEILKSLQAKKPPHVPQLAGA